MPSITPIVLRPKNPDLTGNPRTYLTSPVAATATTLEVLSTSGFTITGTTDYAVVVGEWGQKCEIATVDANGAATDTNSFTVSALKYPHSESEPVTFIPWNQIKFYGRTTTGGSNNTLATVDIDCSNQYTEYINDQSTYSFFVFSYYNSVTSKESAVSSELTSTTYSRYTYKKIIESALRKAFTKIDQGRDSVLSWDVALDICQDGIDEIMSRKRNWIFLHKIDSTSVDTVASTAYVDYPSDNSYIEYILVNDRRLDWMDKNDYDRYTTSGNTVTTGQPYAYTLKNSKVYLYPTPNTAYDVTYEYYRYPTATSLETTVERELVVTLTYYCAAQFAYARGNEKVGDKKFLLFQSALEKLAEEYTGALQIGSAEYVQRTSQNNYDEEDLLM